MNIKSLIPSFFVLFLMASCNSGPSLQQYFVDHREDANFLSIDIPISVLDLDGVELTESQKAAVTSIKKLNVLAFRKKDSNQNQMTTEISQIKSILDTQGWDELMKINSKMGKGVVKVVGADDAIDEVVLFGEHPEKGFMVVRMLGDNMNPANLIPLLKAIEKSNYRGEGLKDLEGFFEG